MGRGGVVQPSASARSFRRALLGVLAVVLSVVCGIGLAAAATGDREGAASAYRRYITLRENAEPSLQPQLVKVRTELARIERERIQ